jgi:hypothetical protein
MVTTLKNMMEAMGPERRKRIEARADALIAETLGIGQEGVSRLEKRSDLLLSTLRGYVEAMGGRLRLTAEFPERPTVLLTGLAAMEDDMPSPSRRRQPGK